MKIVRERRKGNEARLQKNTIGAVSHTEINIAGILTINGFDVVFFILRPTFRDAADKKTPRSMLLLICSRA